jgi:3-phenylpropionate/cinnamic acid dioxygenase small subunit
MSAEALQRLQLAEECRDLVYREGRLIDERRWQEWLALFTPDCEFWVPSWHDDAPTRDPHTEVSLMYYQGRFGLEERVWRITSGLSAASRPLPRTCHVVGSVQLVEADAERAQVTASFTAHTYRLDRTHAFFGLYDYTLRRTPEGLRIARKRVVVMNDLIPNTLDIYSI